MKKFFVIVIIILNVNLYFSQELLADVTVDYSSVQTSNTQVFKTLETALKSFINQTKWTDKKYDINERVRCVFFFTITERPSINKFKGTLTIQSQRPVFDSDYNTTVLNYLDKSIEFDYVEFEQLIFDQRRFSGKNLTDLIGFYVYMILGYDADTFSNLGGTDYFKLSQSISKNSESQGYSGWSAFDNIGSRSVVIDDILKPTTNVLREVMYQYHMKGLDNFSKNELNSKNYIINSIIRLLNFQNNLNLFPLDIFLLTKKEEILSIFSGGQPATADFQKMKETLEIISPLDKEKYWSKMKK